LSGAIQFLDRASGEIRSEFVLGERGLRFLYGNRVGRMLTGAVLRRESVSRLYGRLQRQPRSRSRIPEFARRLGIDLAEVELPIEAYRTLDDFFTRHLKSGARPIDPDPNHLVSPADGRVLAYQEVTGTLKVKGSSVSLSELLGGEDAAAPYQGGAALVVRLAPADYHRFHFPDAGEATPSHPIGTGLHSVNPIALEGGAPAFRNKRTISTLTSERFGDLAIIEVGALLVGRIDQTYRPGHVDRGAEKGLFHFGGSTVVLIARPGCLTLDADLVETSRTGLETYLRMGTRIGAVPVVD